MLHPSPDPFIALRFRFWLGHRAIKADRVIHALAAIQTIPHQRPPLPPAVTDIDERATAIFYRLTVAWLILGLVVTTLLAFVVEP